VRLARGTAAWFPGGVFRLFDAPPLEEAFVGGVLLDVGGLALLGRIDGGALGRLVGSNFGMVAGAFLTLVRRWNRWHVPVFRHWISLQRAIAQGIEPDLPAKFHVDCN
jgi:hypothetical protein